MDFKAAKRDAAQRDQAERDAQREQAQATDQRIDEARTMIEYMAWQDDIVQEARRHADRVGMQDYAERVRTNPYATAMRNRNGVDTRFTGETPRIDAMTGRARKLAGPLRGLIKMTPVVSTPNLGLRAERFTTDFQTVVSQRVPIGEVDQGAEDGLTHGFVEFVFDEGIEAVPMRASKARKFAQRGDLPFRTTGQIDRVGVRVYVGGEKSDPNSDLTPVGEIFADLLNPRERFRIAETDDALNGSGDLGQALRNVMGVTQPDGAPEALNEIFQIVALATAEEQRQAQANPVPPAGP